MLLRLSLCTAVPPSTYWGAFPCPAAMTEPLLHASSNQDVSGLTLAAEGHFSLLLVFFYPCLWSTDPGLG